MIYWPTAPRLRIRLTPGHLITLQQHTLNPKLPLKHSAGPDLAGGMQKENGRKKERDRERQGYSEMEIEKGRLLNNSCLIVCVF